MAKLAPEDPEHMPVLGAQSYALGESEFDDATAALPNEKRARSGARGHRSRRRKSVIPAGFFSVVRGASASGDERWPFCASPPHAQPP